MEQISRRLSRIEGLTITVRKDDQRLSNRTPGLRISWDPVALGITGPEVARILFTTEPRIVVHEEGGRRWRQRSGRETGIGITAYMMQPGDARVAGNRLHAILSDPARARARGNSGTAAGAPAAAPAGQTAPAANLVGRWQVEIQYLGSRSQHAFTITQEGGQLRGRHRGDFVERDLWGALEGRNVRLQSSYREGGSQLSYGFSGEVEPDGARMSGALDLGEYLSASWSARRA
jgi:L-seryl-tRNA(Ser) seleniumtransferase